MMQHFPKSKTASKYSLGKGSFSTLPTARTTRLSDAPANRFCAANLLGSSGWGHFHLAGIILWRIFCYLSLCARRGLIDFIGSSAYPKCESIAGALPYDAPVRRSWRQSVRDGPESERNAAKGK
jgi:hypothetical protein